jgi:hypothetical protein
LAEHLDLNWPAEDQDLTVVILLGCFEDWLLGDLEQMLKKFLIEPSEHILTMPIMSGLKHNH